MAQATLTVTDTVDGIAAAVTFDPPIDLHAPATPAQKVVLDYWPKQIGLLARLHKRIRIWRICRRIADLRDANEIGRAMIRNDQALIDRQAREIAQLECELVLLGGLTTCAG